MTDEKNPFGLHTVTPYLVVDGVLSLVAFLEQVFDATPRGTPQIRQDGSLQHAELMIGDSVIMMGEPMPGTKPMPGMLYVYVDNCDAKYSEALAAGATSVIEPVDYPHGDRYGGVKDPTGNVWWIVTHIGR